MGTKLWQKSYESDKKIEAFTVGNDAQLDLLLANYDVLGSLAHIHMLESIDLLTKEEVESLSKELIIIYESIALENFTIDEGIEDVHSQVEVILTNKLGDVGKKIHSGRSRNDQVLVDLKLFMRDQIEETVGHTDRLFKELIGLSNKYKDHLLPGYTHLQIAMPSSFGLWFSAYAESLIDDMHVLLAAYKVANKNPLGSAAGYGSSFPLNRKMTTELLGFEAMNINVVYAQMGRGKTEKTVASALSSIAYTLNKLAMDAALYMNQNFGFISFPDELTTGSSIMPHKKNPDVFEIIRGKCNQIHSVANEINLITTNLPSGYHREMQLIKEHFFPAFEMINECLEMTRFMLSHIKVKENILDDDKYKYLFSVEAVNKLVLEGVPFRDAYKQVGEMIAEDNFQRPDKIDHVHEGSIGNLMTEEIEKSMEQAINDFHFEKKNKAIEKLITQ